MALNHFRANHFAARHFQALRRFVLVAVGGGGYLWDSYPYQSREAFYRAKAALAKELPEEVISTAAAVISKASVAQPGPIDLGRAEADFRAFLAQLLVEWQEDYRNALILEYQLSLFEAEEAQIVWLLFEM